MADLSNITKKYTNGEVTVVWKPGKCIHSTICVNGLPSVFDNNKKPWITPEGSDTQHIIEQVNQCPSGALSYFLNAKGEDKSIEDTQSEIIIEPRPNGPLMIYGNITLKKADGTTEKKTKVTAFCRCGQSNNKPFCDGTHNKIEFKG